MQIDLDFIFIRTINIKRCDVKSHKITNFIRDFYGSGGQGVKKAVGLPTAQARPNGAVGTKPPRDTPTWRLPAQAARRSKAST